MKPIIVVQRIITPEGIFEVPVFFEPSQWYRGPYPTSVSMEGVPQEYLEKLITYAQGFGWRWDDSMKRFYPAE
jgi:hypothetical protein